MRVAGLVLLVGLCVSVDVTAQDRASTDTVAIAPARGLVAHWCFDDESHLGADCSGSGFDSVSETTVTPTPGVIGGGAWFDGTSWIDVPSPFFLDGLCTATVGAFLWQDDPGPQQQIIGSGDQRGGTDPLSFQLTEAMLTNVGYEDTGNASWIKADRDSVAALTPPRWLHLAVTLATEGEGSKLQVYIDGRLDRETTRLERTCIGYDIPMPTQIGAVHGTQNWLGKLDELRIYNRALDAGEVSRLARY
jgi:hypothetical protein